MDVLKIAAFSNGSTGGNPAGVVIGESLPSESQMQNIAKEVGFSETAFAARRGDSWRVRYFSPESEVPFCGHATIALGAALALQNGENIYNLELNEANITVEGKRDGETIAAALQSPETSSKPAPPETVDGALRLFGLSSKDLDQRIPVAFAEAGASHLVIAVNSRKHVADMAYEFESGRLFMEQHSLVTIAIVFAESSKLFHVRNAFASGGVYEDPATGAAAAALAGYLRDLGWPCDGEFTISQGEDMGSPSNLTVKFASEPGSSIRVSGTARLM